MYDKKSVPAKHVVRLEQLIQNRIRDEFPLDDVQVASFGDWMDAELLLLETAFAPFVTNASRRGAIGR
jgi:hypothetical protein